MLCPWDSEVSQQPVVGGDVSLQPLTVEKQGGTSEQREMSRSLMKRHRCWYRSLTAALTQAGKKREHENNE